MPRLDNLNQLISTLRSDISRKAGQTTKTDAGKSVSKKQKNKTNAPDTLQSTEALELKIETRIKELADEPDVSNEHLRYIFLESVLLWKFGEHMSADPKFNDMVRHIDASIQTDSDLKNKFQSMLEMFKT